MQQTLLHTIKCTPLLLLAFLAGTYQLHAQYTSFGSASCNGDCCQLTQDQSGQAGAIFSTSTVDLTQPFSFSCSMNFGSKDASGADGIVFIFAAAPGLGIGGGGIGYQGLPASVGIEMDDYQNGGFGDPAGDHIAIISQGDVNHGSGNNLAGPIGLPNIEDGAYHCFFVNWDPGSNTLSASLDGTSISYTGNITSIVGTSAYYGFSSGTGSLSNPHTVCFGAPAVAPMLDVTICPGENTVLQADPGGTSYVWQANPSLSATNIPNPTATPTTTTTYFVTINYSCGFSGTDDVTVIVATPPAAMASSNSPICEGETLQLNATGGTSYSWSGPLSFSSSSPNPTIDNVMPANAGTYTVTVTDVDGCTGSASTQVVINPNPIVSIVALNAPLCSNGPVVTMQGIPAGGTWGGAANPLGQVDPTMLPPGLHIITYSYTDANGCSNSTETSIEVVPAPNVQIFPAGPFCPTDPPTYILADPAGGLWSGVADFQGLVTPSMLPPGGHVVHYTYTDFYGCTDEDEIIIQVQPGTPVSIQPAGPFCPDAPVQTLTATPTGGIWSGAANGSGEINPTNLGPGLHDVFYLFSIGGACPGSDTITIEVLTPPTAVISGMGTICEGSGQTVPITITTTGVGPLEITYVIDNQNPETLTIPAGTTTIDASTAGTYTITDVVDANGCHGTGSGSAMVEVVGSPTVSGLVKSCNGDNTSYIVTFTVTEGDTATYTITGAVSGSFTTSPPYVFTSAPIPTGTSYNWVVNDGNDCDPVTISGSHACVCTTDAGTMASPTLRACVGSTVTATHDDNETLDANDALIFVLHSSNGNSLGTIFQSNSTGQFGFLPPMVAGVTYYISAVAGDSIANGGVDLLDGCLSVSFGQPVVFTALPTASISSNQDICKGEQATISFALTGNPPLDVVYSNGTQNFTLNNILNGHTITVTPTATTTYSLVSVGDNSNPACTTSGGNSVTVSVWPHVLALQTLTICEGESVVLGGAPQTMPGIYKDTLSTFHGCDSIIVSTLVVNDLDTTYLMDASCNPANVGTFVQNLMNQNGCDSTVILSVSFSLTDTTLLNSTTCDPALAGVFTQNLTTPEGCDSTVITTVALLDSDTTLLFGNSCNPANVGVFTQNLTNQNGCDSTVIRTVNYSLTDTTLLNSTTCDPASTGVFTQNLTTSEGCDSTVITTVALLDSDTTNLSALSCDPADVGVFTQNLTNQNGCDSTVILTVGYSPGDTTALSSTTCDPTLAGVFTQNLTNQYGCDSLVITSVALLPSDTTVLMDSSCNPLDTGMVVQILSNQFGCDSTVVSITTLIPPAQCGTLASLSGSTIPCGSTVGPLTLTVTLGQPPFNYAWSGPQSGSGTTAQVNVPQIIGNLPPGTYSVTVTAANGLTATATAVIDQILPPTLTAGVISNYNGKDISCFGEMDGSAIAVAAGGQLPFEYVWSNGTTSTATASTATSLGAGIYLVTVTDANGCTATSSVSLTDPAPLAIAFSVNDLNCFGQNSGAVTVQPTGGTAPYTYSLDGGAPQTASTFSGLAEGSYEVQATDANGCQTFEFIGINAPVPVDVNLGDDQYIELGDQTVLNAIVSLPFDSVAMIAWQGIDSVECPGCMDQLIAPLFTTTYAVTVTGNNGCSDSDEVTVYVNRTRKVYVPSAFSPDGDGTNDVFMIFADHKSVKRVKSFLVFSRWGETVFQYFDFQPNDPTYGWDGTHRGGQLNPAVFVWFAEVEFTDGEVLLLEGDVNLIR
ncbi:MAG: gliding motility-associated C-terminal domain-containing protein [Saprospiraceae bacterium]|nr:gliding motility-associated C-terminal domain-containing protein [Saprospiraceae bacterium]MCF8249814.1 gliding motility-associated C-terminal domain-containing protein [Saprospiraceae bacterium]MCF8313435.1 gliding motility-associated C-terminal domain-containing protein [Saprospiraceae bacterium]MCF8442148.1 gliding motility-associated C-terminal domain-containing protein [Saprospiraceae bacterium]